MKWEKFAISWQQAIHENKVKNVVIVALVLTNVISVAGWFRSHETVVLIPPNLAVAASVSPTRASDSYLKAWALYVAELSGNITPGNADFVMSSLEELLSPEAYRSIRDALVRQISDIKADSLTVSFEPRQMVYETDTHKIFVYGQFSSKGSTGEPLRSMRTYEMQIAVRFGRPWVTAFVPYPGQPKTVAYWKTAKAEDTRIPMSSAPRATHPTGVATEAAASTE